MFHMLTDYHKNRYKWAFDAQREFIDSFVVLNIQENEIHPLSEDNDRFRPESSFLLSLN